MSVLGVQLTFPDRFFYNSPAGLEPTWSASRALFDSLNLIFTVVIVIVIVMTMVRSGPVVKLADRVIALRKPVNIVAGGPKLDLPTDVVMSTASRQ